MRKKVIVEGGVVWNSIWSHGHEVSKALAKKYEVYYLEPVRTHAKHAHLHEKTTYPVPEHVTVIQHEKILNDIGLKYLSYSESDNLRIIKAIQPKILITYQCFLGLRAFNYALKKKIKTIYMLVDEYAALSRSLPVKLYLVFAERYFLRKSNGVLCTAKVLVEHGKKYNKNVVYIPNGIHQKSLQEKGGTPTVTKKKRLVVGFVGTIGNWVDTSWFVSIANAHPTIDVHVVGGGDGFASLEQAKKKNKLRNLKLFGFLPHGDALKKMHTFDIAIIPFKVNKITHAVSPIKLFEYWSMHKPVVAPKTKELEQFKEIFFAERIAQDIIPLLKSAELRENYAKKGNALLNKFDWEVLGKKIRSFIQKLEAA